MKSKWLGALVAFALLLVPVSALAWNLGVHVERDCTGVTVTANPKNQNDGLFFVWKPVSVTGTGFFPYTEDDQTLSGTVTITWQKFGKITGHAYPNFHSEDYEWSKTRQNSCPSFFEPPDPYSTFTPDCAGVQQEDFAWVGGEDGGFVSQGAQYIHYWDQPYDLEEWEGYAEPEQCDLPEPSEDIRVEQDCATWKVYRQYFEDGILVGEELIDDGRWHDQYAQETKTVDVGEGSVTFTEDLECIKCEPKLWMWLLFLEDEAGNILDTGALWDRGYDGTYNAPSVERQQACLGWTATRAWGGYVDSCNGWFDSDHRNLDAHYTYQRYDVNTLLDKPCSSCGGQ